MAIKYTNIFHSKALYKYPNCDFGVIIPHHLATQVSTEE
jgi:hypothetical protein